MPTRRVFLRRVAGVMAGAVVLRPAAGVAQGLEQFGSSEPPCAPDARLTPVVPRDATYRDGAPLRGSLLEPGVTGPPLLLTGTVSGVTCGRIKGADVHFWHADPRGQYDMTGYRFRGRQLTNASGQYRLTTLMPGAAAGRAPHIGVRVRISGKPDFWTEVFFPNQPLNVKDGRFRKELVATSRSDGMTFDITLDM